VNEKPAGGGKHIRPGGPPSHGGPLDRPPAFKRVMLMLAVLSGILLLQSRDGSSETAYWGTAAVTLVYLVGITQFGTLFSAIMQLTGGRWAVHYCQLGERATLAFAPLALLGWAALFYGGRHTLFYWLAEPPAGNDQALSPWLDERWLLLRQLAAMGLYYAVSLRYFALPLPAHRRTLWAPWVIICFLLSHTLLAWDLGMMLTPHFHSSVFPLSFAMGSLLGGAGWLLLLERLHGRLPLSPGGGSALPAAGIFKDVEPAHALRNMGILLTGFTLLWLYLYWAEFFVIWFGNLPHEFRLLWKQMYGHYAPYYWLMLAGCFFVPFALLLFARVKRSPVAMGGIAVVLNIGVWLNRYLIIQTALSDAHRPLGSWPEISLSLGALSAFLLLWLLLCRRFPVPAGHDALPRK